MPKKRKKRQVETPRELDKPLPNRPSAHRHPKKVYLGQIGPIKIQPWANRSPDGIPL